MNYSKIIVIISMFIALSACADRNKVKVSDNVIQLQSEKDFDKIISGETTVIVDFHAEWCRPCKVQGPILDEIASEMNGKVVVLKVDVDKFPEIATHYQVGSIPTLIMFKSKIQIWDAVGIRQKSELMAILKQNI